MPVLRQEGQPLRYSVLPLPARYVAIYSQLLSDNNVMIRTTPRPEGPWSGERTLFTAQQPAAGNVYDARAQ
jgi:hypothetical protein